MIRPNDAAQLGGLQRIVRLLSREGIEYWLFGGWAVDFYAGKVTRPHDDVDIAIWLHDHERVVDLLLADGWRHAPEPDEDGGTGYDRDGVRLELTFLVRDAEGSVCIPFRAGLMRWDAFGNDSRELGGVRAQVIKLEALKRGKSDARDDEADAAKDRADAKTLARLS